MIKIKRITKYQYIPSLKKFHIKYYSGNNEGWPVGSGWYPKNPVRYFETKD
jgi:hypothetical protein